MAAEKKRNSGISTEAGNQAAGKKPSRQAIRCPRCDGDAVYRYGKTKNGKQRYLCLSCGRQFVSGSTAVKIQQRPVCPSCGAKMHIYRRQAGILRFRCSRYPECRTFKKIEINSEEA